MSAYLQFGHDSWNLLEDSTCDSYRGAILSPVNDSPDTVRARIQRLGARRQQFELVLDPQLYNPYADRGKLPEWSYYPADFETADQSDSRWWVERGRESVGAAVEIGLNAVCTPAFIPRQFDDEYYRFCVEIADGVSMAARQAGLGCLLTAIVSIRDLSNPIRALQIASVLSSVDCDRIYLVFYCGDEVSPRHPIEDGIGLTSAIQLIRLLSVNLRVHVAFCSHDLILWKFGGAADVSTGKFMNLRRFSPARWAEDEAGQRNQNSYWNEGSLLTLLRDQDVRRLDLKSWYTPERLSDTPASGAIMEILRAGSGAAWQALSWKQYLKWFGLAEAAWCDAQRALRDLQTCDTNWAAVAAHRVQFVDRYNTGDHVRIWLAAAAAA